MDIRVPRLGEGAESGSVINILVKEGDKVQKDQTLIELENEKAIAPIPSTEAGVITKILVKVGDKISVGQPIVSLSQDGAAAAPQAEKSQASSPAPSGAPQQSPSPAAPSYSAAQAPASYGAPYQYQSAGGFAPPASPTVRKMAVDLGIDLTRVKGSEGGGRISMNDLKAYILYLQGVAFSGQPAAGIQAPKAAAPLADFSKWGPISKKPVSPLRKKIAEKMHESWSTIPHVTQNDEVDITDLMAASKHYAPAYEAHNVRLTLTAIVLKACVQALKKYPQFNSSYDEAAGEIVVKEYYHIGVAVDTEQGLIVPVLRDVDKKSLLEISRELGDLAEKTRQRKVSADDLRGGTFTVSNLGGIGGTHFTPIINKPEVAILGVSRGSYRAVVRDKKIEQRLIMPISVSYDHRVIDGADGARFTRELSTALESFPSAAMALDKDKGSKGAKTAAKAAESPKSKTNFKKSKVLVKGKR